MPPVDPEPSLTGERDFEARPYTADEQRVADWLVKRSGIGGGDDPIGFLMGSLVFGVVERDRYKQALIDIGEMPASNAAIYAVIQKVLGRG